MVYANKEALPKPKTRIEKLLYTIAITDKLRNNLKNNNLASLSNNREIPATLLSVLCSVSVAAGVELKSIDDLYDLTYLFREYIERNDKLTLDDVKAIFNNSCYALSNNLISVNSNFLDIVKNFFNNTFTSSSNIVTNNYSLPNTPNYFKVHSLSDDVATYNFGGLAISFEYSYSDSDYSYYNILFYKDGVLVYTNANFKYYNDSHIRIFIDTRLSRLYLRSHSNINDSELSSTGIPFSRFQLTLKEITFSYSGGYNWDNIENKREDNEVAFPIPSDLNHLVGQNIEGFWENADGLVGRGDILLPVVSDVSIDVCEPYSFLSLDNGGNNEEVELVHPQSRIEKLLNAIIVGNSDNIEQAKSRIEQYLHHILNDEGNILPFPQSRIEKLFYAIATGDSSDIKEAKSRVEQYLHYILNK